MGFDIWYVTDLENIIFTLIYARLSSEDNRYLGRTRTQGEVRS